VISVKIGVVGCGRIATIVHLPALKKISRIDVTAAVDVHESRLNETLEKFQIAQGYTDYQQMLKKANIDAVLVCAPPEKHFSIVLDSIQNEKHVICEKPLATTIEEGLTIKKAFEAQQRKTSVPLILMPAHNFIFTPCFDLALQLMKKGEIGNLQKITGCSSSNLMFYGAKTDFRLNAKGGVIEDLLPHVIYLCHETGGRLKKVLSIEPRRRGFTGVDDVDVEAKLLSGVKATLSAKWTGFVPSLKLNLIGDSGQIMLDLLKTPHNVTVVTGKEKRKTIQMGRRIRQYLDVFRNKHPSYINEHIHFLNCIEGSEKQRVTVDDGIELVRTLSETMALFKESPYSPVGREKAAIVRVEEDVEASVVKSIDLLGGLNVKKNDKVVVKPNVCFPKNLDNMIITDPRVLEAVLNILKKKAKNVLVVESDSRSGTADDRVTRSGTMDVIKKCGAEFLNLSEDETEEHEVAGLTLQIPKTVLNADFFINLPKLKTSSMKQMFVTIAMKNMFGILANKKKYKLHKALVDILVFLNRTIRQDLTIVDGIVGMQGFGPDRGSPMNMNLIVSGLNPVTTEAVCCQVMGINPYAVEPLWRAYKAGIGEIDTEKIQILGENIDSVKKKFNVPLLSPRNILDALETTIKVHLRK
jgi:predicted dehydrogenase/uncharacterized protein (DUF362 family)